MIIALTPMFLLPSANVNELQNGNNSREELVENHVDSNTPEDNVFHINDNNHYEYLADY